MRLTEAELVEKRKKSIASLDKFWYVDFGNLQIRRRPEENFLCKINFHVFCQKHDIEELYYWLKVMEASEDGIVFPVAIERDSIRSGAYPTKYRLSGGWTIRVSELKFLKRGPLLSEDGKDILVNESNVWKVACNLTKDVKNFISDVKFILSVVIAISVLISILWKYGLPGVMSILLYKLIR